MNDKSFLGGFGAPGADLNAADFRSIIEKALANVAVGAKVLAVIPDKTRDDNTASLFPIAVEILKSKGVKILDAIVAQGTHSPMTANEKRQKIGIGDGATIEKLGKVFDHRWDSPAELVSIGELSAEKVVELTGGLIEKAVPLTINKRLAPGNYDLILQFGATMPHEVAGFAGGAKYFFPGIAGAELTHATHWLGALATVEQVIGRVETPTRHLIEAAADFISAPIISFTSVVSRNAKNRLQTHALFAGDFRLAVRRAAEVSRHVHIKYTGRKYRRVVALLDEHYEELWLGGKASYRLGAIIEDGGELIIYAPRLRCISDTHGALIERYGYAPLEIVRELVAQSGELQNNLCVAAHLTQVAYAGRRDENGRVTPRYQIILASQIDAEICRRVNLGFMDYREFRRENYENDADTFVVERAGRDLYRVE